MGAGPVVDALLLVIKGIGGWFKGTKDATGAIGFTICMSMSQVRLNFPQLIRVLGFWRKILVNIFGIV